MGLVDELNDIQLIDAAKEYLELNKHLINTTSYQLIETLMFSLDRYVGPKPKQKSTWSQVWDKFDNILRCK